jgi:cell division protein FtsB
MQMRAKRYLAPAAVAIPAVVVFIMLLYSGCKSKKSQSDSDVDKTVARYVAEAEKLRRENARLRAALEDANTQAEQVRREIERLSQEDAGLQAYSEGTNRPVDSGETDFKSYPDRTKVDNVISEYSVATSAERKLELLNSIDMLVHGEDPAVIVLIESALQDPDVRVNRAGAELLEGFETVRALPTIEKALYSNDEETRELAVAPLANIKDPKTVELLTIALDDESADVREAAFDSLDEQTPKIQMEVFDVAIRLSHDDVKIETIARLEELSNHQALEILLVGLDDPDPVIRDEVNRSLSFLIDQEFESYEQGLDWWNENREKLDSELFPLEDDEQ